MRVCQSRKSMHAVMNNTGYGLMTITRSGITALAVAKHSLFSHAYFCTIYHVTI